jgi:hypothetical protein
LYGNFSSLLPHIMWPLKFAQWLLTQKFLGNQRIRDKISTFLCINLCFMFLPFFFQHKVGQTQQWCPRTHVLVDSLHYLCIEYAPKMSCISEAPVHAYVVCICGCIYGPVSMQRDFAPVIVLSSRIPRRWEQLYLLGPTE